MIGGIRPKGTCHRSKGTDRARYTAGTAAVFLRAVVVFAAGIGYDDHSVDDVISGITCRIERYRSGIGIGSTRYIAYQAADVNIADHHVFIGIAAIGTDYFDVFDIGAFDVSRQHTDVRRAFALDLTRQVQVLDSAAGAYLAEQSRIILFGNDGEVINAFTVADKGSGKAHIQPIFVDSISICRQSAAERHCGGLRYDYIVCQLERDVVHKSRALIDPVDIHQLGIRGYYERIAAGAVAGYERQFGKCRISRTVHRHVAYLCTYRGAGAGTEADAHARQIAVVQSDDIGTVIDP